MPNDKSNSIIDFYRIIALLTVGISAPPVMEEKKPATAKAVLPAKPKVDEGAKLLQSLTQVVGALETVYKDVIDDAENKPDKVQKEIAKIGDLLKKLKEIETAKEKNQLTKEQVESVKQDVKSTLLSFFKASKPTVVAKYFNIPIRSIVPLDAPEWMQAMGTANLDDWGKIFGFVAEKLWNETFSIKDKDGKTHTIELQGVSRHDARTTQTAWDLGSKLLKREELAGRAIPGMKAIPFGYIGMTLNWRDYTQRELAFHGIYGNDNPPAVLSNSTGQPYTPLDDNRVYQRLLKDHITSDGKRTIKVHNGTMTYGVTSMGETMVVNAAGNEGQYSPPNLTNLQLYHPNLLNVAAATVALDPKTGKRDDKSPTEFAYYSTGNPSTFLTMKTQRYAKDGTEISDQYLDVRFRRVVEDNLWKIAMELAGVTDRKKLPQSVVDAIKHDKEEFVKAILKREGADEKGRVKDLKGTSFIAPQVAMIIEIAKLKYPNLNQAEIKDALCSSCVPIIHRRNVDNNGNPAELLHDVPWNVMDKENGRAFSPLAGWGEFVIDDEVTGKHSDGWEKFIQRLEAMNQAIKQNSSKQRPRLVELPMDKFTEIVTEEDKKRIASADKAVSDAFQKVEKLYNVKRSDAVQKLLDKHAYAEALSLFQDELVKLTQKPEEVAANLKNASEAVYEAEKGRRHTYVFEVKDEQDLTLTMASMRFKFKDQTRTDNYAVLQAPDCPPLDLILANPKDDFGNSSGVAGVSTPAVMRKSAKGLWTIHTMQELDDKGTELILYGTEKAAGVFDPRTVLTAIDKGVAADRMSKIPKENILQVTDLPKRLRELNGLEGALAVKPARLPRINPASRAEHQELLEKMLANSKTIKALKEIGKAAPAAENGTIKRVSKNDEQTRPQVVDMALVHMASEFGDGLANARSVSGEPMRLSWGDMAMALTSQAKANSSEISSIEKVAAAHNLRPAGGKPILWHADGGKQSDPLAAMPDFIRKAYNAISEGAVASADAKRATGHPESGTIIPDAVNHPPQSQRKKVAEVH